jgi:polysaccharide biosynthesis protein PslG
MAGGASEAKGEFGIATGSAILDLDAAELGRYLDGVAVAGASMIRTDFAWPLIQPDGPSRFDWSVPDRIVAAALRRRLKVVAILDYTPVWARSAGSNQFYPPGDVSAFANFCSAVAGRYRKSGVRAYEIWNEPNQSYFWRPLPDPERYAALLSAAYRAIKAADRGVTVLGGATTGGWAASSGPKMSPVAFLDRVYSAGGGGSFDAWSHHPYTFDFTLSSTSAWSLMGDTSRSLRSVMTEHRDGLKKIWVTEFGASTSDIAEAAQRQLIAGACSRFPRYAFAGPLCCYSYRDAGPDTSDSEQNFGLVRYDWSEKPALDAFRASSLDAFRTAA